VKQVDLSTASELQDFTVPLWILLAKCRIWKDLSNCPTLLIVLLNT